MAHLWPEGQKTSWFGFSCRAWRMVLWQHGKQNLNNKNIIIKYWNPLFFHYARFKQIASLFYLTRRQRVDNTSPKKVIGNCYKFCNFLKEQFWKAIWKRLRFFFIFTQARVSLAITQTPRERGARIYNAQCNYYNVIQWLQSTVY